MPPLIAKWNALKDEDKDLFPLLEVIIALYVLNVHVLACNGVVIATCACSVCHQWLPLCKKAFFPIVSRFSSVACLWLLKLCTRLKSL